MAIIIRARDLASRAIGSVKKEISSLEKVGQRAMRGLTTAVKGLAVASAVGLVGAITLGTRSLADLERTMAQTNAVIESTGGKAGVTADQVRSLADELEGLTTVDDKVIQDGENMLLTFTGISKKVFPQATKAALNMAVAMAKGDATQVDMQASAIQLGKALNDPIKGVSALRKVGVTFTDQQQKQIKTMVEAGDLVGAQTVILKELEVEFGKAGEAAGTGFAADMRRVEDAGEAATTALARGVMPVLTRVARFLSEKLADPAVIAAIDDIGAGLGDAAMSALDFIESFDFAAIGQGLSMAKDAAGAIVGAFLSLPPWVQAAVVTGWGLNKVTGGFVGDLVGELGKGLVKGVLGMNAGVVNINAGVVNGGGGIPGAPGGGGKNILGAAASLASKVVIVGMVAEVADLIHGAISPGGGLPGRIETGTQLPTDQLQWPFGPKGTPKVDFGPIQGVLGGDSVIPAVEKLNTTYQQSSGAAAARQNVTNERLESIRGAVDTGAQRHVAATERSEAIAASDAARTRAQIAAGDTRSEMALARTGGQITGRASADSASERATISRASAAERAALAAKDLSVAVKAIFNAKVSVSAKNVKSQLTSQTLVAKGTQRIQS